MSKMISHNMYLVQDDNYNYPIYLNTYACIYIKVYFIQLKIMILTQYPYMIITYRIQGVKASLFCTNGELQNSCEHCGGHAVKITM